MKCRKLKKVNLMRIREVVKYAAIKSCPTSIYSDFIEKIHYYITLFIMGCSNS
jgi:hypothetical protein